MARNWNILNVLQFQFTDIATLVFNERMTAPRAESINTEVLVSEPVSIPTQLGTRFRCNSACDSDSTRHPIAMPPELRAEFTGILKPVFVFIGVPSTTPSPECSKNVLIDVAEDAFAYSMPVVVCPAREPWVKVRYYITRFSFVMKA